MSFIFAKIMASMKKMTYQYDCSNLDLSNLPIWNYSQIKLAITNANRA